MFDAAFNPFNRKDLTFFTRWLMYWLDEIVVDGRGEYLGNELDIVMNYAYTEDLSLQLIGAWFFPGEYFKQSSQMTNAAGQTVGNGDETAQELVASLTLNF
ncbi:MAG: hypothetical protein HY447_05785 [Candidatus Omnitrophica bacterium]|nr:hypothetical protein [Candidatus Omnitrophota bacterium]